MNHNSSCIFSSVNTLDIQEHPIRTNCITFITGYLLVVIWPLLDALTACLYQDELQWASAWLYRATKDSKYLDFLQNNQGGSGTEFSWDNKYPGAQLLATQVTLSLILHAHPPNSQLVIIHQ
jgi:hypothetical protein